MRKMIKYILSNLALRLLFWIGKTFNKNHLGTISKVLGSIVYLIPFKRKHMSLNNMRIALGNEYSERDLKKLLKAYSIEFILTALHITHIAARKLHLHPWARADGLEHLQRALSRGKGVIALSGHFSNFPVMIAWLAERGYPVAVLYKEAKYFPKNFLYDLISSFRIKPIPFRSDKEVTAEIIRALNEGMIVFMLSDQSRPGVYARFFGQITQCQKGAFVIAKRKDAPIVPVFIVREEGVYRIIVYPELKWQKEGDCKAITDEQIVPLVESYNSILEGLIRNYPSQYLWSHRRFIVVTPQK